jgi:signal transduction histidine kinase
MRRRAAAAALLMSAAVTIPCAAWYVSGAREAARDAAVLERQAEAGAEAEAMRLAEHLSTRLDVLLETESSRPPDHYHPHREAPTNPCACPRFRPSPLAGADPLIGAHFQREPDGDLVFPAIPEEGRAAAAEAAAGIEAALDGPPAARPASIAAPPPSGPERLLAVGPFRWRTAALPSGPALLAVREVRTTSRVRRQGFVVPSGALEATVSSPSSPVHVRPGPATEPNQAPLALPGAAWAVSVSPGPGLEDAHRLADERRSAFRRTFAAGAAAALFAALLVVGLVWQADRAVAERARFAASAAHELRTPLAGLRLHAEMLASGLGRPDRGAEYAERIVHEVTRLGRVVGNVLGFTRLERGGLALDLRQGDLAAAVRETLERLEPAAAQAGARLVLREESGHGLPPLAFDRDAVDTVVANLVDNALKYAREAADRTVDVSLTHDGDRVVLAVADRGPGVPPRLRRRLFRPFARGVGAEAPSGLGLGLALVDGIARGHGGAAGFRPRPGGGSVFFVAFPVFPSA